MRAGDIDETPATHENAVEYALRMAEEKALTVDSAPDELVLAADTVVLLGREIMGKPRDRADAVRMLTALAGRRHEVITAVCLRRGEDLVTDHASTAVSVGPMTPAEIEAYVDSGEPMDKAGAYAIQGLASKYIDRIVGSYSNVVGLPVALVYRMMPQFRTRCRVRSQRVFVKKCRARSVIW